jgi:hypothetical protein
MHPSLPLRTENPEELSNSLSYAYIRVNGRMSRKRARVPGTTYSILGLLPAVQAATIVAFFRMERA